MLNKCHCGLLKITSVVRLSEVLLQKLQRYYPKPPVEDFLREMFYFNSREYIKTKLRFVNDQLSYSFQRLNKRFPIIPQDSLNAISTE